ncbi:endoplasmic reticulum-Golgi intermediate compartment protein 2 [Sarcoptes scabiei]|nr:endoplasmic reticulum-Golgi intermediate compartment protein 2 [Sarcoptes scabiei]
MVVEDIEDCFGQLEVESLGRSPDRSFAIRYNPRRNKSDTVENESTDWNLIQNDCFLPGKHSIFVRSWGCTHNTSDSEYMMGLLAQSGYEIVDNISKADLCILNSCTVKNPAEDQFRNEIQNVLNQNKKVIVSGCVSQSDYRASYLENISIIGVHQIDKVVEIVEETLKGNVVRYLSFRKQDNKKAGGASLQMPKIRRNKLIEIIAISTGCLNSCTYCKTKHARGKLGSYSIDEIVSRAQTAFEEGCKELWITSEDTGAYGRDIGTNLPELLNKIIKIIPEDCMMRIGMTNPPYILNHLDEMIKILLHPRVYAFLHIPVQSGCDEVLYDMKREYCIEDFCVIVEKIRKQ